MKRCLAEGRDRFELWGAAEGTALSTIQVV
jgi:hypothetical protein